MAVFDMPGKQIGSPLSDWNRRYLHDRLEDRGESECAKIRLKKRARNQIDRTVDPVPKAREADWTGPNTIEES